MKIVINRYRFKTIRTDSHPTEVIDGKLFIDGLKICDTTENGSTSIPSGTYAVSIGKCKRLNRNIPLIRVTPYTCSDCALCIKRTVAYRKEVDKIYHVLNHIIRRGIAKGIPEEEYSAEALAADMAFPEHPKREELPFCPQLKAGNGVIGMTDGSILVGQYLMPGVVIQSRPAFEALFERIRKSFSRGNEVTLTIIQS